MHRTNHSKTIQRQNYDHYLIVVIISKLSYFLNDEGFVHDTTFAVFPFSYSHILSHICYHRWYCLDNLYIARLTFLLFHALLRSDDWFVYKIIGFDLASNKLCKPQNELICKSNKFLVVIIIILPPSLSITVDKSGMRSTNKLSILHQDNQLNFSISFHSVFQQKEINQVRKR